MVAARSTHEERGVPEPTEEERLKAFLHVVAKIPLTWKCLVCGEEFANHPGGPMPYARQTKMSDDGKRVEVGEICRKCFEK